MSKKIGLMGGSFNPIHRGHVSLARIIRTKLGLDEVWLLLSPMNPLKAGDGELIEDDLRLKMAQIAVENEEGIEVCDVEMRLPRPNYTIRTLEYLRTHYAGNRFSLVIGADNLLIFEKWKDADILMRDYDVVVYPRPGYDLDGIEERYPHVRVVRDVPEFPISSTEIRRNLREGIGCEKWLDSKVLEFICRKKLYGVS